MLSQFLQLKFLIKNVSTGKTVVYTIVTVFFTLVLLLSFSLSQHCCDIRYFNNDQLKPNQNIFVNSIHKYIVPIYVSEFRICTAFQTEKISTNGQKYKNHFLPGAWHERKGWPCGPIWCT